MQRKQFHVYIMTNKPRGVLYTGMSGSIHHRVLQHKSERKPCFTSRYNLTRLVYFEEAGSAYEAIVREKQIKGWLRSKKIALIESVNPEWKDLSDGWYDEIDPVDGGTKGKSF